MPTIDKSAKGRSVSDGLVGALAIMASDTLDQVRETVHMAHDALMKAEGRGQRP